MAVRRKKKEITAAELTTYLKDKRIRLDCGHYYQLHPLSNILIITEKGKTYCHNCYD